MSVQPSMPAPQRSANRGRAAWPPSVSAVLVSAVYAVLTWQLLWFEHADPRPPVALFALPSVVAGAVIGRWAAGALPLLIVATYIAVGLPISPSDQPEAAMLVAFPFGVVLCRAAGRRLRH